MARFTKLQVLQTAAAQGMMPLFYHQDVELGKKVLKACYDGGARMLEFTNRGDFAHEVFGELNKYCARKVPYMPGCGTLTEIGKAEELGCDIVKLFPGSVYGPGFIKSIKGPQPWTTIMPTGGVAPTEENLTAWFDAGAVCVGMGSKQPMR